MVTESQIVSQIWKEKTERVPFEPKGSYSTDDQIALLAFLLNLQYYYEIYVNLTAEEILARIDDDFKKLESEMYGNIPNAIKEGTSTDIQKLLEEYGLDDVPFNEDDLVEQDLIEQSIHSTLNQLKNDVKTKCLYILTYVGKLDLAANFARAVKGLSDDIVFNIGLARQKAEREFLRFVYGDDTLYRWVTAGDKRVCAVCVAKSREKPKKLDEWDYDHPYGRCTLVPVNSSNNEGIGGFF